MLAKKALRDFRKNFGQFFSIFILAALAIVMYVTFEGHVLSEERAREVFHEACNVSDLWVYGENFSDEQLETIRDLDIVKDAQLRTVVRGSATDIDGLQCDIYLMRENTVNKAYLIEGEEFDPEDTEGVWLTDTFAKLHDIKVGDDFTITYNGVTFTRVVKGLIEAAEYEYRQAEGDADVYLQNIAFVYMSYDAFPIREYVTHMIETEKITVEKIRESTDLLDEMSDRLKEYGMTLDDLTKDKLLEAVDNMSDEKLSRLMPFTEMVIVTVDGKGLTHEDEIADALNNDYAAIIDRDSVAGLARLDSELSQHRSFSYAFVVIFMTIALLVIATSMKRMVERQRTQIGTLNAMGMKYSKIVLHYISFSFWVSLAGALVGLAVGYFVGSPFMLDIFGGVYVVPGRKNAFAPVYIVFVLLIVLICVLSSYLSCRKLLKVHPAEALHPAAPRSGKRTVFEKLPFWDKLGFSSQYNLRDISRGKLRCLMCIIGTAVGMMLMLYGTACNGLLSEMLSIAYDRTAPSAYQVTISEGAKLGDVEAMSDELDGELIMTDAIEVSRVTNARSADKEKGTVTVIEGKGLYNILDLDNQIIKMEEGEVGLSRKFAEELGVNVGDKIYWHFYSKNDWYEATVGVIYRSSEAQGIAMLRTDLEKAGAEFTPTLLATDNDPSDYADETYVTAINTRADMIDAFKESMEIVDLLVYMMIIFSSILVVVVLYNSGTLSFNERMKEFATLKVLGFGSGKIRNMMMQQNVWLSVIGIIIGAPLGRASFNAMMNSNGDNFDYNFSISITAYLSAALFVLIVSMLVSFMFSRRIRKLDMVEVFKGAE